MYKVKFPPVHMANQDGIVAIGGDLELSTLVSAYQQGIFPWPISTEYPLCWFAPDPRGIIDLNEIKIPKSFKKKINKFDREIVIKFNQNFLEVINNCRNIPRKDQQSTWITDEIVNGYINLHNHGFAYSIEAYRDEELKAGLYGVNIGDFFSGESMFYKETDLSKYCLYKLLMHLKSKGVEWLDTQMVTEVVRTFGGKEIDRNEFMKLLAAKNFNLSSSLFNS